MRSISWQESESDREKRVKSTPHHMRHDPERGRQVCPIERTCGRIGLDDGKHTKGWRMDVRMAAPLFCKGTAHVRKCETVGKSCVVKHQMNAD